MDDNEILEAFNQIDPRNALGSDVLSGLFFKENWNIVGKDVLTYCKDMLNENKNVRDVNDTIIVLILKLSDSKDMSN